jgi:hypothetical protein
VGLLGRLEGQPVRRVELGEPTRLRRRHDHHGRDHDDGRSNHNHGRTDDHDTGDDDIDDDPADNDHGGHQHRGSADDHDNDGAIHYVLVRRADYDNLVAAVNVNADNYYAVDLLNAARTLVDHVNDDRARDDRF